MTSDRTVTETVTVNAMKKREANPAPWNPPAGSGDGYKPPPLARFAASQISSACSCIVAPTTKTITTTLKATVTTTQQVSLQITMFAWLLKFNVHVDYSATSHHGDWVRHRHSNRHYNCHWNCTFKMFWNLTLCASTNTVNFFRSQMTLPRSRRQLQTQSPHLLRLPHRPE